MIEIILDRKSTNFGIGFFEEVTSSDWGYYLYETPRRWALGFRL
jgi:hypothetical protein